jgi:hypothetical protein
MSAEEGWFIFDAAVGLDGEKPENVRAMIEFFKEYGRFDIRVPAS